MRRSITSLRKERRKDRTQIEFQKAVMSRKDERQKENLGTKQKDVEEGPGEKRQTGVTQK